ncbi:MAG TPA: AMP-binding protein, partial [Polyangiaceae bacterium]|nr:AMP-binding protein [Polyangiaceae bacterium]
AIPGNEIRLLGEDGREVRRGEVGELYARSGLMVAGYLNDDASTREAMRGGGFSVGDLARIDARGCYHLVGRKRELIISGGVNVYPSEIEAVIEAHPMVREVAVVGKADDEWGERVCAFVVLASGAGEQEALGRLGAYCRERLSGPKRPRELVVVDGLPRNATGKVLKTELRDRVG